MAEARANGNRESNEDVFSTLGRFPRLGTAAQRQWRTVRAVSCRHRVHRLPYRAIGQWKRRSEADQFENEGTAMGIIVQCSGCGGKFHVPDKSAGKQVKCRKCANVIQVGGLPQRLSVRLPRLATEIAETPRTFPPLPLPAQKDGNVIVAAVPSCPVCGSGSVRNYRTSFSLEIFRTPQKCDTCGSVWKPAVSRAKVWRNILWLPVGVALSLLLFRIIILISVLPALVAFVC